MAKKRRVITVDPERCVGCKRCELECALAHSISKDLVRAMREEPRPSSRVEVEPAGEFSVPLQCRHCEDAPCVEVCPAKALSHEEGSGTVTLDAGRCIGCHACTMVCPFGVIRESADGRAIVKCDLCAERVARGEEPACVTACHTAALKFTSPDEISGEKRKKAVDAFLNALDKA